MVCSGKKIVPDKNEKGAKIFYTKLPEEIEKFSSKSVRISAKPVKISSHIGKFLVNLLKF
jgi:hypothetical protein